ncbi:MAG: hypothetical protein OXF77_00670 [Thaumarchaeota archaeon]|nr:hypothetical protein [Nitrososphaerota archaeon]
MDKKLLVTGSVMTVIGMYFSTYLYFSMPVAANNMNENDINKLLLDQQTNNNLNILAGVLIGIGFLLILISLGNKLHYGHASKKTKTKPIK